MIYKIMNKLTLIPLISALSCSSLIHAGGMGDQSDLSGVAGFISLEGGYSVTTVDNYDFTISGPGGGTISSIKKAQHYTGRLAAGLLNMMDEQWGMTSELGWAYFGRTTLNPPNIDFGDFTIQHTVTGFDALIGIAFIQPNYSLSFKAGGLIQNLTRKITATSSLATLALPGVSTFTSKENQTAVLPEIKLGGSYNFDNNWAITAAYLMALGSSSRTSSSIDQFGNVNYTSNNLNPTINSLLLGIQYTC